MFVQLNRLLNDVGLSTDSILLLCIAQMEFHLLKFCCFLNRSVGSQTLANALDSTSVSSTQNDFKSETIIHVFL